MDSKVEQTLLVIGAPEHNAAAYHLSGFLAVSYTHLTLPTNREV